MAPSKMCGIEVPLDDAVAQRMGFANLAAFEEYRSRKSLSNGHLPDADSLLKDVCNLKAETDKMWKYIVELEGRLVATGAERIG